MAINHRQRRQPHVEESPNANRQRVLQHLTQHYNFNKFQISAVMAAIQHESAFKLGQVGDRDMGAGRTAHGLFQWREGRNTNMQRFTAARAGQDPVTAQVDFAMHEMGIPRRDNLNVPGPSFGIERGPGDMLKRSRNLRQATEAMHQFERYRDPNETARRERTASGFVQEAAAAIGRAYEYVRDTAAGLFNRAFGSEQPAVAAAGAPQGAPQGNQQTTVFAMHSVGGERPQTTSYTQYGVPTRSPEQRAPVSAVPMRRPSTAMAPPPAPVFRMRSVDEPPPPAPRRNA